MQNFFCLYNTQAQHDTRYSYNNYTKYGFHFHIWQISLQDSSCQSTDQNSSRHNNTDRVQSAGFF